jgi:hypothetical protein
MQAAVDMGVLRVIRENTYYIVPLPCAVWAAVRRPLRVCFARSWGIRETSSLHSTRE